MIPPEHILEELYRIHPQVRLGWCGHESADDEDGGRELNQGSFAIIQLYHKRDAMASFREPWGDRGPIYGRDFDRMARVPIYVWDVSPWDVFQGRVVPMVERFATPIVKRVRDSAIEKGKTLQSLADDLSEEAGDRLYWEAQRDTTGGVPSTADVTEEDKAKLRGDDKPDLTTTFDPGEPKKKDG